MRFFNENDKYIILENVVFPPIHNQMEYETTYSFIPVNVVYFLDLKPHGHSTTAQTHYNTTHIFLWYTLFSITPTSDRSLAQCGPHATLAWHQESDA
jgi:hypothetical protein